MPLTLTCSSFAENASIPQRHTCDGPDLSPALTWSGAPAETKSFALIMDDPDAPDPAAPKMTWVHWVLYNIPAPTSSLAEGMTGRDLPSGTAEGVNDWKSTGYRGPCPPRGKHRYFIKLYALDTELPDQGKPTKAKLESAIKGHVLAEAHYMGTYARQS